MYISIFYVFTLSFVKNGYFLWAAKKTKKSVTKRLILVLKSFFFLKPLRGHVGYEDVHTIFYLIFYIFKYIKNVFQIKGTYAPGS
jgi:hypothetical protein